MNIHAQSATAQAQSNSDDDEGLARHLEATGDFRILRRLVPRTPTPAPDGYTGKIGIILDFETTGLDPAKDEIIEVAMVKFRYSATDEITGVSGAFQSYNEPAFPIPALVTDLTGITNEMVAGHRIDIATLEAFVADANIVIAHNAAFDRKLSTPEKKCIGLPERRCISDDGKKAPELGAFCLGIRFGWNYPPAGPRRHGVSGACSD